MKCLIIAAGRGWRLRSRGDSKPLYPILGIPLIGRVMLSASQGGIDEFVVVTGFNGEVLRSHLDVFADRHQIKVTHVVNEEWEKPNGVSVLKARPYLQEPFLMSMSDHLYDPRLVSELLSVPISDGETILAVDYNITNPFIDLNDVTRVLIENERIVRIGKGIEPYTAFDTGVFYATPGLFDAIEESIAATGDHSLSGGMNVLTRGRKARTFDIGNRFWFDVDEPAEADLAQLILGQILEETSTGHLPVRMHFSSGWRELLLSNGLSELLHHNNGADEEKEVITKETPY